MIIIQWNLPQRTLRYGPPQYNGQTMFPHWFCNRNSTFSTSERWTTSNLETMGRTHVPKGQVAVQNSLQEQTMMEVSDKNNIVKISIKFLTSSYSVVPRKYIILSSVDCPFIVSTRDLWLGFMQTTPLSVTCTFIIEGCGCLATSKMGTTSDKSPAPNVFVIQRFHCSHAM